VIRSIVQGLSAAAILSFSLLSGCATVSAIQLPENVACHNIMYAEMASLAYHLDPIAAPGWYIPEAPKDWHRIRADGQAISAADHRAASDHPFTGLAYDIWQHDVDKHSYVFAYRGSEGTVDDWLFGNLMAPISPPYRQARNELAAFLRDVDSSATITAVGHSLGGGLALSVSLRVGVRAVVFNTSPRVNDGWGTEANDLERLLIFQTGEPLRRFTPLWAGKLESITKPDHRYEAALSHGASHRHDKLACGMRKFCSGTSHPADSLCQ
jgi:hypothetical protein